MFCVLFQIKCLVFIVVKITYQPLMTTPEANFDKVSIFSKKHFFPTKITFFTHPKTPFFRFLSLWLVRSIWMNHTPMKMPCSFS